MVKTPEEYFAALNFDMPQTTGSHLSLNAAEESFVQKYLGSDLLAHLPEVQPEALMPSAVFSATQEKTVQDQKEKPHADLRTRLLSESSVQMVSFYVREQIFLLPVSVIVEVLRHMPLTRLPRAPSFVAGVVNLRGKVTPLLYLDALLTLEKNYRYTQKSFIIVCSIKEMHLGFIIDNVHTLYTLKQEQFSWNAEIHLGSGAEFLCGIADIEGKLYGIVNPDIILEKLLTG